MRISMVFKDKNSRLRKMTGNVMVNDKSNKGYYIWTGSVEDNRTGEKYFVKFIEELKTPESIKNTNNYDSYDYYKKARQRMEKETLFKMRYPFIAFVYDFPEHAKVTFEENVNHRDMDVLFILEEYCGENTLFNHYKGNQPRNKKNMYIHMLQLLYAINYYTMIQNEDHIIHRDLKPGNVMITDDGVKIIDFDWAHIDQKMGTRDGSRAIYGTFNYAHPMQHDSKIKKSIIGMDIYSMGLIFLFVINGHNYIEDVGEITNKPHDFKLHLRYVDANTPEWLCKIIARMIAVPEKQYKYAEEVITDFKNALKEYEWDVLEEFENSLLEKNHILPSKSNSETIGMDILVIENNDSVHTRYIRSLKNGENIVIQTSGKMKIRFFRVGNNIFYRAINQKNSVIESSFDISAQKNDILLTDNQLNSKIIVNIIK